MRPLSRNRDRKEFSHGLTASGTQLVTSLVFLATGARTLGCGGGATSPVLPPPPPPPSISINVSPSTGNVTLSNTISFTVQNATDSTVTWSVNGVAGGNATVGTITGAGTYAAPSDLPSRASVQVTATSHQDPTKSASASVTVTQRPASGTSTADICLFSQSGFDTSMTYTVSGSGDIAVIAKQPAGLGIIHLTLQIPATAVPGARILFIQNTNLDKTAASGAREVN